MDNHKTGKFKKGQSVHGWPKEIFILTFNNQNLKKKLDTRETYF